MTKLVALKSDQRLCSSGLTHALWAQDDSAGAHWSKDQRISLWAAQVQGIQQACADLCPS